MVTFWTVDSKSQKSHLYLVLFIGGVFLEAGNKDGVVQTFFPVAGNRDGVAQTFLQVAGNRVGVAQTSFLIIEAG